MGAGDPPVGRFSSQPVVSTVVSSSNTHGTRLRSPVLSPKRVKQGQEAPGRACFISASAATQLHWDTLPRAARTRTRHARFASAARRCLGRRRSLVSLRGGGGLARGQQGATCKAYSKQPNRGARGGSGKSKYPFSATQLSGYETRTKGVKSSLPAPRHTQHTARSTAQSGQRTPKSIVRARLPKGQIVLA